MNDATKLIREALRELDKEFLSERDMYRAGIRSEQSLRNDRWSGKNIFPYYKIGKNVRYLKSEVLEVLEQNKFDAA
jgi:hypothetical protein